MNNNEQEIIELEKRVSELLTWKNSRLEERLINPIDLTSRKTLDYWKATSTSGSVTGLFIATGKILNSSYLTLATAYSTYGIEILINGVKKVVALMPFLWPCTADSTTDFITSTNGHHNLNNGELLTFTTDGTLPSPLLKNFGVYVVNRTATTFQVSSSVGGAPIDITDNGSGTHYFAVLS